MGDEDEGFFGSDDQSTQNLPPWYLTQTNPINCGPACATMALRFSGYSAPGYQVSIRNSAREFGLQLWYNTSFQTFFQKRGIWGRTARPGVWRGGKVYVEDRPASDADLQILLSRYLFIGHWIVRQGGAYYCPIRGRLAGTTYLRKDVWPIVVTAPR